jgi:hypothetical protein
MCPTNKDSWILLPRMSITELAAAHVRHSEFQLQIGGRSGEICSSKARRAIAAGLSAAQREQLDGAPSSCGFHLGTAAASLIGCVSECGIFCPRDVSGSYGHAHARSGCSPQLQRDARSCPRIERLRMLSRAVWYVENMALAALYEESLARVSDQTPSFIDLHALRYSHSRPHHTRRSCGSHPIRCSPSHDLPWGTRIPGPCYKYKVRHL